ncbi:MAG: DoxX family protein [Pseudohongiellaceae bacterium]
MLGVIDTLFGRLGEKLQDLGWLLFRLLSSSMFMTHGFGKLFGANPQPMTGAGMTSVDIGGVLTFPMPMEINALYVAGAVELFGGGLIFIGLWTRLSALTAMIIMIFAYLTAHLALFPTFNNGELAAMYILAFLLLFSFGPGQFSADTWFSVRRQEKRKAKTDGFG